MTGLTPRNNFILSLFLFSLMVGSTLCQISFYPRDSVRTLPGAQGLQSLIILDFPLLPSSLQPENFTATWTLPSGEMITEDSQSVDRRLLVQDGLSYLDVGVYTCRVQDNNNPSSPPIEATVELRLLLTLTAISKSVVTLVLDNASSVEMSCDMSNYIRPDNQLQWLKDGQLITSGQNRRTVAFTNGTRLGQIGALVIGPSRLSTITISNPIPSDSGTYGCRVAGTTKSVDIELLVQDLDATIQSSTYEVATHMTSNSPTSTTGTPSSTSRTTSSNILLTGLIPGFFAIALMTIGILILIVYVVRKRKLKSVHTLSNEPESHDLGVSVAINPAQESAMQVTNNTPQDLEIVIQVVATSPFQENDIGVTANLAYGARQALSVNPAYGARQAHTPMSVNPAYGARQAHTPMSVNPAYYLVESEQTGPDEQTHDHEYSYIY